MPVVLIEKQTPQITVLTLNRPERRNALTIELMTDLAAALENAATDPAHRIVILRGAGKAFCTGLDLQEAALKDPHDTAKAAARLFLVLAETRLVTIATVHGAAVAGVSIPRSADWAAARSHKTTSSEIFRRKKLCGRWSTAAWRCRSAIRLRP